MHRGRARLGRIVALAAAVFVSCGRKADDRALLLSPEESAWLEAHKAELAFAPDPFYAPFEFHDVADGQTKGLAHDYFLLVEKKLGIRFRRLTAPTFSYILTLARQRDVAAVNAVTATPERSEYLLFTRPYIEVKNIIVTRKKENSITQLHDLSGLRVSVVKGYAVVEYLAAQLADARFDVVESDLLALLNVAYGISDAAVLDLATASYLTEKEGIPNIKIAGDVGFPVRLSIGSRKDWPELNVILSKGIDAISPAEHDAILRKWINLENANALNRQEFMVALLAAAILVILVLVAGLVWNRQLKRQIASRTAHLDRALAEKETLLRELFHRTKNNMQVIVSMIELRAGSMKEPDDKRYMKELQTRILTMALVQQKLYEAEDLSSLDLGQYIIDVVHLLAQTMAVPQDKIRFAFDVQHVPILFDLAVPCGLVMNELVANAIQHAFPSDRQGTVSIRVRALEDSSVELEVADDGAGLPSDMKIDEDGSMGLQIVMAMVRTQLGGTIEFERTGGLACRIHFDARRYGTRV